VSHCVCKILFIIGAGFRLLLQNVYGGGDHFSVDTVYMFSALYAIVCHTGGSVNKKAELLQR